MTVIEGCYNRSPPRDCSHEALPFVEAAVKAKLAGSIETQPGASHSVTNFGLA
jgi:hypothetical protein